MDEDKYPAAELSANLVNEIKSFEENLSDRAKKEIILIAYEKDQNAGR